jgi:TonB-dependent starch-binding outer membrane protein SusC
VLCTPGELKLVDQNGDGLITGADRVILGYADPVFHGGLGNRFRYGPLSLEAWIGFVSGNKIINAGAAYGELAIMQANERGVVRNHWTPENPDTPIPRPRANRMRLLYDTFVEDGSYIRLQTVTVGYDVPARRIPGAQTARLYVTGENLWLGTGYSGFDPDVNSMGGDARMGGIDIGAYPRARSWNVGVNVTF